MLVHFLQSGVSPPVLPNLPALYSDRFRADRPLRELQLNDANLLPQLPGKSSYSSSVTVHSVERDWFETNHRSLSELFLGFFAYYRDFHYAEDMITVKGAVSRRVYR